MNLSWKMFVADNPNSCKNELCINLASYWEQQNLCTPRLGNNGVLLVQPKVLLDCFTWCACTNWAVRCNCSPIATRQCWNKQENQEEQTLAHYCGYCHKSPSLCFCLRTRWYNFNVYIWDIPSHPRKLLKFTYPPSATSAQDSWTVEVAAKIW